MICPGCRFFSALIATALLLAGCASRAPEVTYYHLIAREGLQIDRPPLERRENLAVSIVPLTLPDSLKRPQIVTRAEAGRLKLARSHHWGGLLEKEILAVLVSNLGDLLGTDQVATSSDALRLEPQYRVMLRLDRFDGTPGQEATLHASWSILAPQERTARNVHSSRIRISIGEEGYLPLVRAQSRALYELSLEISQELIRRSAEEPAALSSAKPRPPG